MERPSDTRQTESVRDFIMFIGGRIKGYAQHFESSCDLNQHECSILFILMQNGSQAVKEIARRMPNVSHSTLTRLLDSLEQKTYIERKLDPHDRRSFVISMTDKASGLMQRFPDLLNALAQQMLEPLTPAERLMLLELFRKIRSNMEQRND
ncbi:MarR family winged helix-turn-helix transcriptional regulator [Paenibacillus hamazuiensis]|uniref:MarR family winged helix-turn-helix transcriptional regulator n=1 Tax=Paenibacillus hamazuiensis TaxID=2936508 RepID=UPI00200C74CE|nr:MarR family transcriptional regulator [Paenibacillus hamazuiensis]